MKWYTDAAWSFGFPGACFSQDICEFFKPEAVCYPIVGAPRCRCYPVSVSKVSIYTEYGFGK